MAILDVGCHVTFYDRDTKQLKKTVYSCKVNATITMLPHALLFSPVAEDAALKSSLLFLAAAVVLVGNVGVFAIAVVLLPDCCFFDRDFSRWTSPVTGEERESYRISTGSRFPWFRIYPIRVVLYATVYSVALYKWWRFVCS